MLNVSMNRHTAVCFRSGEYDSEFPKYLNNARENRADG